MCTCVMCITMGRWAFTDDFLNFFPPLLRLSKQSTQGVHILRNNSSYGLFQLVGSGSCKRPSRTCNMGTMILVFNMHYFTLKSFLLANKNILDEGHGSWFMESLESRYKQCFFNNMISTYTKDFSQKK